MLVYHCANINRAVIYIFNEKRKCCNHRCPDSVYFNTLLLIVYLSAIETLICRREMTLTGSTSFGFAQNMIHNLRQMPQKSSLEIKKILYFDLSFFCYSFLAHLSTTCSGGAIVTGHRPSSVRPSVCPSVRPSVRPLTISLKIFSSKTRRPILIKLGRNVPWVKLYKNC